jgi:long-subunit fatty acid transport protein
MKRLLTASFLFAAILAAAATAWPADGLEATALGARSLGMAGVDLAIATDALALDSNPAGLIQLPGQRVDLNGGLLSPILHFQNDLNDTNAQQRLYGSGAIAYGIHPQGASVAGGVGLYLNNDTGVADFRLKNPVLGDNTRYFSQFQTAKLVGAIDWAPHPMISLALAPAFSLSRFDADLPYNKNPDWMQGVADASDNLTFAKLFKMPLSQGGFGLDEATFRMQMRELNAYGVGGKFGAMIMPTERFRIGLVYDLQVNMKYYGHDKIDWAPQFAAIGQSLTQQYISQGLSPANAQAKVRNQMNYWGIEKNLQTTYNSKMEFSWPEDVGLGFSYKPIDSLLLGVDVKWIQWSHTMAGPVRASMKFASYWTGPHILGSDPHITPLPAHWNDQIVAAVGAQYAFIKDFYGRLGYNYASNVEANPNRVGLIMPGLIEHHIAAGLGYRYSLFEVNAAYQFGVPRTVKAGSADYWGAEYNNCKVTQGSHDVMLSASFLF